MNLAVDYGRTPSYLLSQLQNQWFPIVLFLCVLISVIILNKKIKNSHLLFLFLAWSFCLLPVSGLVNFAFQDISTTANHYVYFSLFIFSLILIQIIILKNLRGYLVTFGIVAYMGFFVFQSLERVRIWQTSKIFFETMFTNNPQSYSAMMGLAKLASDDEKLHEKALKLLTQALVKKPKDIIAISNVATVHLRLRQYTEVMAMEPYLFDLKFQEAILKRNVDGSNFLNALGQAMHFNGNNDLAILYLCQAEQLNPISLSIRQNVERLFMLLPLQELPHSCPRFSNFDDFLKTAAQTSHSKPKDKE